MEYKYGTFTTEQIAETKVKLRKQIFFLLLLVDPDTKDKYIHINVNDAFQNILNIIDGYNELLYYPQELVTILGLLEAARMEYNSDKFDYSKYRKLVLDAGNKVLSIKEV